MSGQVLTFANYSPGRYAALQAALAAKGLQIAGNVGEVKKFGADVSYAYGENALTLLVRHAPFMHSMETFTLALSKEVNGIPE